MFMLLFHRRLASAWSNCAGSATYEVTDQNPNPKTHPNPILTRTLKLKENKNDTGI